MDARFRCCCCSGEAASAALRRDARNDIGRMMTKKGHGIVPTSSLTDSIVRERERERERSSSSQREWGPERTLCVCEVKMCARFFFIFVE